MKALKESRINIHFYCKNTLVVLLKVLVQKKKLKILRKKDKIGNVNDLFRIPAVTKEGLYSLLKLLIQYMKMFT